MKLTYKTVVATVALAALFQLSPVASAMQHQERANWCWAACIQEVEALRGVPRTQTQIATDMNGAPLDVPARPAAVAQLLMAYGRQASEIDRPATPQELFATLAGGFKIIALVDPTGNAMEGHFVVIGGIGPNNTVIVGDPAFGTVRPVPIAQLYSWTWLG